MKAYAEIETAFHEADQTGTPIEAVVRGQEYRVYPGGTAVVGSAVKMPDSDSGSLSPQGARVGIGG